MGEGPNPGVGTRGRKVKVANESGKDGKLLNFRFSEGPPKVEIPIMRGETKIRD